MANLYKIKNLAKEKGWSLSYICSKMGVAASYFTDVKNEKLKISPERLQQIADILGTTPEYLTDQTDIKKRQPDESDQRDDELMDWIASLNKAKVTRLLDIAHLIELPEHDYERISEMIRLFLDADK